MIILNKIILIHNIINKDHSNLLIIMKVNNLKILIIIIQTKIKIFNLLIILIINQVKLCLFR